MVTSVFQMPASMDSVWTDSDHTRAPASPALKENTAIYVSVNEFIVSWCYQVRFHRVFSLGRILMCRSDRDVDAKAAENHERKHANERKKTLTMK